MSVFILSSKKETVEQQIQKQLKQLKCKNHLIEIVGQWPSNENVEDIVAALD